MNKERSEDKKRDPDISHIPNDRPIPSKNPEENPPEIPVDEPTIPGATKEVPIKEPDKKPKIYV